MIIMIENVLIFKKFKRIRKACCKTQLIYQLLYTTAVYYLLIIKSKMFTLFQLFGFFSIGYDYILNQTDKKMVFVLV